MNTKLAVVGFILTLALLALPGFSDTRPFAAPGLPGWSAIAVADVIVVGILEAVAPNNNGGDITLRAEKVLKGSVVSKDLKLHYATVTELNRGLPKLLDNMRNKRVVALLLENPRFDGNEGHGFHYYLYGLEARDVMVPDSSETELYIKDELNREAKQISAMDSLAVTQQGPLRDQVRADVEMLASSIESERDHAVDDLLSLKCEAVPYIIMEMSDRRPFMGTLKLPNRGPEAFEAYAQYSEKTVLSALTAILNWKTSGGIGLDDRGPEQKQYDYWLIFLANNPQLKDSKMWKGSCE